MSADLHWFKSSYSGDQGECVEVALSWTKSSHSGGQGGECVEVALTPTTIHIRDSKNRTDSAPTLQLATATWSAFLESLS